MAEYKFLSILLATPPMGLEPTTSVLVKAVLYPLSYGGGARVSHRSAFPDQL